MARLRERLAQTQQEQQVERDSQGQVHTQKVKIQSLQEENRRLLDEIQDTQDHRRRLVEEYWLQMGGTPDSADWQEKERRLRDRVISGEFDREDIQQENNDLLNDMQSLRTEHQEVTRRVIELEQINHTLSDQLDQLQPVSQERFQ